MEKFIAYCLNFKQTNILRGSLRIPPTTMVVKDWAIVTHFEDGGESQHGKMQSRIENLVKQFYHRAFVKLCIPNPF